MPFWRKEEDYNFTESLAREGWAWEFLRRNTIYGDDYKRAQELEDEFRSEYNNRSSHFITMSSKPNEKPFFIYEPEKKEAESESQWVIRCINSNVLPQKYRPSIGYAKKWGLSGAMQDPNINTPPSFIYGKPRPVILDWESAGMYFKDDESLNEQIDEWLVLAFDLQQPREKQLGRAKKLFKEKYVSKGIKKSTKVANKKAEWKRYLRVLDAGSDKAGPREIASVLLPDKENSYDDGHKGSKIIDYSRREAERLVNKGYKNIITSNDYTL